MSPVIDIEKSPPAPLALGPGLVLAERFVLLEMLGEGAMGAVWSAEEIASGKKVALKVLKLGARDARLRFLREAWAASRARHRNVVDVLDLVETADGTLVMVMELLCGETLGTLLRREGKLGVAETCTMLLSVVEALAAVHRAKLIHRDVKPDNIFIEHRPDGQHVVKLLDFGVAKVLTEEAPAAQVSDEGTLGTPYYMAPEQVLPESELDQRVDVWSLGVTLFECLVGHRPTEATSVARVLRRILLGDVDSIASAMPSLPLALQRMTTRMMAADKSARPRLREIAETLAQLAKPRGARVAIVVTATLISTPQRQMTTPRRPYRREAQWRIRNARGRPRPRLHASVPEQTRGRGRPGGTPSPATKSRMRGPALPPPVAGVAGRFATSVSGRAGLALHELA